MSSAETPIQQLVESLQERAKELNCLYRVDEILAEPNRPIVEVCRQLVESVPTGWKYPEVCVVRISIRGERCQSANFEETPWFMTIPILVEGQEVGTLTAGARIVSGKGIKVGDRALLDAPKEASWWRRVWTY